MPWKRLPKTYLRLLGFIFSWNWPESSEVKKHPNGPYHYRASSWWLGVVDFLDRPALVSLGGASLGKLSLVIWSVWVPSLVLICYDTDTSSGLMAVFPESLDSHQADFGFAMYIDVLCIFACKYIRSYTRWWFQIIFCFHPDPCGNDPIWLACFKWVGSTTN